MKEFMFIFLGADYTELNLSPEQMQEQMQKWYGWIEQLRSQDRYVDGKPLLPAAKTVRGASPVVTDGPFAESKELVGGYFIIKAESMEEASELAKGFPDFELGGTVEVREVQQMD
jgi:hypothetical protein